jgi:hypothetical protein
MLASKGEHTFMPGAVYACRQHEAVMARDRGAGQSGPSQCVCRVTDVRAKAAFDIFGPKGTGWPAPAICLFMRDGSFGPEALKSDSFYNFTGLFIA